MDIHELLGIVETVEITTHGRSSGKPRRLEIWMYEIDGRHIITGTPGPRDWFANLMANPTLTLHLPGDINLDAVATRVDDVAFRRRVFDAEKTSWYRSQVQVERLVSESPMVELRFNELPD